MSAMRGNRLAAALGLALAMSASTALAAGGRPFPSPPKEWPETIHDQRIVSFALLDRLEYAWGDDADTRVWDAQGWIGGDWNKLWLKTEGESVAGGETEEAQFEALYARLIAPFWYVQAGIRHDTRPEPSRTYAAFGIQGLGLYWFEVDATAYVSEEGDLSANFEAEYDFRITQRLILQPRFETGIASSEEKELGIGQGFNDLALGLRLRYEFRRELAPYVGVAWHRKLGDTADLAREEGDDVESTALVAGIRAWF